MIPNLAPTGLEALAPNARIVDVREPEEYRGELGHIPGAELVPLGTLPAAASGWDRSCPIVTVCRSGARSGRAAGLLAAMGFSNVQNLEGGMVAWTAAGLPRVRW